MRDIPFEYDIECLNETIEKGLEKALFDSEDMIEKEVFRTAEEIIAAGEKLKIVLVSGRSASGKTTFTKKVCKKLSEMGRDARHISLDDFFLGISHLPLNEDGTYDMESIKGLDVALANECFGKLITEGWADFPTFDFPNQRRGEKWNRVVAGENSIIMIEGIHALNPLLTENLLEEGIMRIYIEPEYSYKLGEKTVFSTEEIRLIRRITRDELFRGWCAEKTLIQWKSVLLGEKIYIEPYIDSAKIKVNSSVMIEPAIFAKITGEMLLKIPEESEFFGMAKGLLEKLFKFIAVEKEILPKDSLLREFVG